MSLYFLFRKMFFLSAPLPYSLCIYIMKELINSYWHGETLNVPFIQTKKKIAKAKKRKVISRQNNKVRFFVFKILTFLQKTVEKFKRVFKSLQNWKRKNTF